MRKATIVPTFNAFVDNLGLHFTNKPMLGKYLKTLVGKKVWVEIYQQKKIRSDSENKYYWGVVVELISEETGMSAEETHEALKFLFLKKHTERGITTVRSTASLSVGEFESYLGEIRKWAAEFLSIVIPLPNEVQL